MLQRMRNLCLLMFPLLFLAGMLYLQGKSLPAAAPAVIPASADNWGLAFPLSLINISEPTTRS